MCGGTTVRQPAGSGLETFSEPEIYKNFQTIVRIFPIIEKRNAKLLYGS